MPEDRCVYCWPNKPAKVPYTAEHVVPEAFGNFKRNLVLNQGVCGECNQFFGNGIDRLIGRGSAEAIRRLDLRIKPAGEVGDVLYDRIDVSLSTNNELDGLKMELGNEQGELVVLLVHQVRFRMQDGGGHIYVTEKELEDASKPLPKGIDVNGEIALVFDTDTAQERLIELLASRDIKPEKTLRETRLAIQPQQEVTVAIRSIVDDMILRAVGKIAFNYMVKIGGIDFAVKPDLDPIRAYIRYGKKPGYQAVQVIRKPILEYDTYKYRQTSGHLLTLDWSENGNDLIGQVSLFNFATYRVVLARSFSGIALPFRKGHFFDIAAREVKPLLGLSKRLFP